MYKLIKSNFFKTWQVSLDFDLATAFNAIENTELEPHSFTFYTSVSVMSSSKIEGESLEIDSYVKHKMLNIDYLPQLIEKPNDLYQAYLFAKENQLNQTNFLHSHQIITAHLLPQQQRGCLRNTEMLVMEHNTGKIQYEAAPIIVLKDCYDMMWQDIEFLVAKKMTVDEVFYYASIIHLVCVNIHPFSDGNGRIARLLEKWFLAEKLGEKAWYIQSEQFYYKNVNDYYKNLSRLGMFYETLVYEKSLPFLLMLSRSLVEKK
jgi:Fic family protein